MTSQASRRSWRGAPLVAALAVLVALAAAPAARADTSGAVTVTASVTTEMSLTLCDTGAEFGDGLSSTGAAQQNTTDTIGVTDPSPDPAEGRFYSWTPSCQVEGTGKFWKVVSTSPWRLTPCATENTGDGASPTMTLARSLRWNVLPSPSTAYADLDSGPRFGQCPGGTGFAYIANAGTFESPLHLYLRVDPTDQAGTFSSMVVWTLTPQ